MNDSTQFDAARQARRITEQAVSWYIEQQEPLSERQRVAFLNWLRASPRHVAEYFAVVQMHGDFKAAAILKTITAEELVERAGRDILGQRCRAVGLYRHRAQKGLGCNRIGYTCRR